MEQFTNDSGSCKQLLRKIAAQTDGRLIYPFMHKGVCCYGILCLSPDRVLDLFEKETGIDSGQVDKQDGRTVVYWPELREEECGTIRAIE